MKVLLCTNSFENVVNGPAKFANLILEINKRYPEHQVRILTEDITQAHPLVYPVKVKIPSFLSLFGQIIRMFIYHRHAMQVRKEFPYDVLVYNNAFIGCWSAIVSKQPTVGMINDDNNLGANLSNLKLKQTWIKQFIFKQFEKASIRFHKKIITNSDYLTKQIINHYKVSASKLVKMYKATDLSTVSFNSNRAFTSPIQILFVKADYNRGGLKDLADALHILKDVSFEVTVVGPANRFASSINAFFKDVHNVKLHFLGEQPQKNISIFLQKMDIFCVPSVKEALGVANMEALAAGLSVISTNAGGIPEVLDYGNNGWLVNPNNPQELAEAIRQCIICPYVRLQKAERGRLFMKRFSKEVMFENFLQILTEQGIKN